MFNKVTKSFQYGQHTVVLETGEIARQSSGAVLVTVEDTVVLATVVAKKDAKSGQDFFPLTVDYIEKTYAAGKIPGGFFKREGKPSEKETLTSRLIDRPLRPLFPEGFYNEVQVVCTVMSCNPEVDPDIAALLGSSAALAIADIDGADTEARRFEHTGQVGQWKARIGEAVVSEARQGQRAELLRQQGVAQRDRILVAEAGGLREDKGAVRFGRESSHRGEEEGEEGVEFSPRDQRDEERDGQRESNERASAQEERVAAGTEAFEGFHSGGAKGEVH